MDTIVAKHLAERASIRTQIMDRMNECVQLREDFRRQRDEGWQSKGARMRSCQEALSMMAIKKVVTAEDKRETEPVPPPPCPLERETVSADGSCQQTCDRDDGPCEGFNKCIGRLGHQRRPHQCRVILESASGSASSQGVAPDQICERESVRTVDSMPADSEQESTLVIPKRIIEDALARLRGLHDDAERMKELEQYG